MHTFIGQSMHLRGNVWFSILHKGTYINLMAKKRERQVGRGNLLIQARGDLCVNYSATDTTP